jgi:hypothetical protein
MSKFKVKLEREYCQPYLDNEKQSGVDIYFLVEIEHNDEGTLKGQSLYIGTDRYKIVESEEIK